MSAGQLILLAQHHDDPWSCCRGDRRATAQRMEPKSICGLPACVTGPQRAGDSCPDTHLRPAQVTNDITAYSSADIFSAVGKTTPVIARFSIVTAQRGAPEWTRDPRGFAVKFYTQEGNWDLVGNNFPVRALLTCMPVAT